MLGVAMLINTQRRDITIVARRSRLREVVGIEQSLGEMSVSCLGQHVAHVVRIKNGILLVTQQILYQTTCIVIR